MMARVASNGLFLFFLSLLTISSSGTLVGFSYNARGITAASSLGRTVSFLELNKVSASHIRVFAADHRVFSTLSNFNVCADLYLDNSLVENLIKSKPSAISSIKTQIVTFLPHVNNIKSIIVSGNNGLSKLLSALKSIHSVLSSFHVDNEVKVSVAFSLSFLENLNRTQEKDDLHRILGFIKRTRSFVVVETSLDMDVELGMKDLFIQSMIQKVTVATSLLSPKDVLIAMIIKSLVIPSAEEVAEFGDRVSKSLENTKITDQVAGLYAEVSSVEDFAEKELKREHEQIFPSSRREILRSFRTALHDDMINPPTVFPTNPGSTPPVTLLPDTPTPTIVTVPATNPANPVTLTPTNPVSTPLPFPNTTPVNVPPTNPSVNPPAPITNPVTTPAPITVPGAQPVTNPVTTYPAPAGNVPVTAPVTNPVAPPATTNAPAIPGQSWCVARSGVTETALQSGLDYACGMGGADCSQIQQGGNCYNPNSLQSHASYAFNSYYQKNPVATSCDFGGTATVVNVNPSTGSCIYPSSSSSSSTPSLPVPPANPATTSPPANPATTSPANPATSPPGIGVSGPPPPVLNSSTNPASSFGFDTPPVLNSPASKSAALQPFIGCAILVTSFVARTIILDK